MRKLLSVRFEWRKVDFIVFDKPGYDLTVFVGSLAINRIFRILPNEDGFYNNIENPPVFMNSLELAKKRLETLILVELKQNR